MRAETAKPLDEHPDRTHDHRHLAVQHSYHHCWLIPDQVPPSRLVILTMNF